VFSPAFIAKLREDIPHEMFVDEGEAMLGQGQLWFDGRGLYDRECGVIPPSAESAIPSAPVHFSGGTEGFGCVTGNPDRTQF